MDRIVVVTKPTPLDELTREYHTQGAARFALESRDRSIEPYLREHAAYNAALAEVGRQLPSDIPAVYAKREELPNFLFRDNDVLVVVGPDGLFVNVAQYVGGQPVLTVNPGAFGAGALMLFNPSRVTGAIAALRAGKAKLEQLPFAKAELDDGRALWGINDIYIGRKDKAASWYDISFEGKQEKQFSDGVIISTGTGSPGWIGSYVTMVEALIGDEAAHELSTLPEPADEELVFLALGPRKGSRLVTGRITPGSELVLKSEMPRGGFIFSDGILEKAIEFNAGATVTVTVGERYVQRVIP